MIGTILLAAGGSRRFGTPKQLLDWQGKPLVRHAALVALEADLGPVRVVLGAADTACREVLDGLPVRLVSNPAWSSGMGTSIAAGMISLNRAELDGVLVTLCDQPLVDAAVLARLAAEFRKRRDVIVCSRHGDSGGPPAVFPPRHFDGLAALDGEDGARSLLRGDPARVTIDFPQAQLDVDTPDDWKHLVAISTPNDEWELATAAGGDGPRVESP